MSEERLKILEMLSEGKISTDEAERLLDAVESNPTDQVNSSPTWPEGLPKHLYVRVEPKNDSADSDQVKVTIPLALVKAGINFFSLLPQETRNEVENAINESGFKFDLNKLNPAEWDALLLALNELEIDVDTSNNRVKVWAG